MAGKEWGGVTNRLLKYGQKAHAKVAKGAKVSETVPLGVPCALGVRLFCQIIKGVKGDEK